MKRTKQAAEKPQTAGYIDPAIPRYSGSVIICAAQNNTDMHPELWALVREFARYHNAGILCGPILYNKSAFAQPDDVDSMQVRFEAECLPFMNDGRVLINDRVLFVGNAHVLPTAKNPLSGFQGIAGDVDAVIIPASKIALECLPALKGATGRTLMSTGTVTKCNYIQRKAGVTAESEHNFGFVFCEPGKMPRQIEYLRGGFFDFNGKEVTQWGMVGDPEAVLTFGDIHAEKCGLDRLEALARIAKAVNPRNVVLHDLLDFTSRNHHNRKNPFFLAEQDFHGASVSGDIFTATRVLNFLQGCCTAQFHIVESNHDMALDRWLNEADWREDTTNAETYLRLALAKLQAVKSGDPWSAFRAAVHYAAESVDMSTDRIRFLQTDQSLCFHGIEHGMHGDKGPNGSRGSLQAFRKLGRPVTVGHSHTPGIQGKAYQVGVGGDLDMGYNMGPSSWRNAHCVAYSNGQRQIIFE